MSAELPFEYTVVHSRRRRTVSLSVDKGQVQVRVPALTDPAWLEGWVRSQVDWVMPRLARQADALDRFQVRIEQGAWLMLRGENVRLHWQRGRCSGVQEEGGQLTVRLSQRISRPESEAVEQVLKQWLVQQAQQELPARCFTLAERTGQRPAKVKVRDYRRKWGQCTSQREITLNWRLIHLPPHLQDYVMIHELCHLEQMNHSPAFWCLVGRYCPEYKALRDEMGLKYPYLIW